jgi:putative ABC transport system permease protein
MFLRAGQEAETIINLVIAADALALIGIGLSSPIFLILLSPLAQRCLRSEKLILLRLAWQGLISDPARSGAVFTAILLGSAYVIYTIAAVGSLRNGVLNWMVATQEADIIVSGSGSIGVFPSSPTIPGDLATAFSAVPGVVAVEPLRLVAQPYEERWLVVASRNPAIFGERQPASLVAGDLARARLGMASGRMIIASQHLVIKHGLSVGDSIKLRTPTGPADFEIGAIVDDYTGGDLGTVFVAPSVFETRWKDHEANAFHIWTDEGANLSQVASEIRNVAATRCDCSTITNAELLSKMGNVLDSIFYSAYAMELVAVLVMVAAISSFFTIALGERQQELATIRSLGATYGQLLVSFVCEALIMGLVGSALGILGGLLFSARFVNTAMQIGAGLKFEFEIPYIAVAATLVVAVATSLAASLGPILHALRANSGRDSAV